MKLEPAALALSEAEALNLQGQPVRLADLWAVRPVVLVFVRHFGCIFCKQQVAQLREIAAEIEARGAELVVVGNGSLEEAQRFSDEQKITFRLLTDPARKSYRLAGLRHGLLTVMSPGVLARGARAFAQGFRQHDVQGDPLQQGGSFVIAAGGHVLFSHVSRSAGDHPDPHLLLAALDLRSSLSDKRDNVHA